MRHHLLAPILCLLPCAALPHPTGTGDMINDLITFSHLAATSDQDDGGGESEYCARIKTRHGLDHEPLTTDRMVCFDVDWDDPSNEPGKDWDEVQPLSLPLIGGPKSIDTNRDLAVHVHECTPSLPWTVSVAFYEVDYSPAGEILNDIAELIEKEGQNVAAIFNVQDPRILAATQASAAVARLAGKWIDRIVNDIDRLGFYNHNFPDGIGDPDQSVKSKGDANGNPIPGAHMSAQFTKTVAKVGRCGPVRPRYFYRGTYPWLTGEGHLCLSNATSPLCVNPGAASQAQFEGLKSVALRIAEMAPEQGTDATAEGLQRMQSALIGYVGDIARHAADAQITAASEQSDFDETLTELSSLTRTADAALMRAVDEIDTAPLIEAIDAYAEIHATLSPQTYGTPFAQTWEQTFMQEMARARGLALRARDAGETDVALGYVGRMLLNYAHLDPATRDAMLPMMFELFGQDITPFFDLDVQAAAESLLSGL